MLHCWLDYNNLYDHGRIAKLQIGGIGQFPVFSGMGNYINRPECSDLKNAAIPPGSYWIVDRPTGGLYSRGQTLVKHIWTGNHYGEWFGLFRKDGVIDDKTAFDAGHGISFYRGGFRMHPLRPDGTGISEGCITFYRHEDFNTVRQALLHTQRHDVLGAGQLQAYGDVTVIGRAPGNCHVEPT